jgi:hypothetical protein
MQIGPRYINSPSVGLPARAGDCLDSLDGLSYALRTSYGICETQAFKVAGKPFHAAVGHQDMERRAS